MLPEVELLAEEVQQVVPVAEVLHPEQREELAEALRSAREPEAERLLRSGRFDFCHAFCESLQVRRLIRPREHCRTWQISCQSLCFARLVWRALPPPSRIQSRLLHLRA